MKKREKIPIKVSLLKVIYKATLSIHYRLASLLDDVITGAFELGEFDRAALLEAAASSANLKILFEEFLAQATEAQVDTLYFAEQEYTNILTMAKTVELANRVQFKNAGIWVH